MQPKSRTAYILGAVIIAAAIVLLVGASNRGSQNRVNIELTSEPTPAPDFSLVTVEGSEIKLSEFKGKKAVVLDFWTTWCPNCRRDMPRLNEFRNKYSEQLEVIGINIQEDESLVRKYIADRKITFPIALDPQGDATKQYGVRYTNYHILIDKQGNVVKHIPGDISEQNIIDLLSVSDVSEEEGEMVKLDISNESNTGNEAKKEFLFRSDNLNTNTAVKSISLDKVLDGGPGKDGIPAINNPKFTSVSEASKKFGDDTDGLVVAVGKTVRFYPYNILVWHEIVNDVIEGKSLAVTFCPLCGSAIVFDTADKFGVSGKLYESNLLMYDKKTESLWSQSIGTAVVGDRTDEKLTIYPSQILSFKKFKDKWPDGKVLSTDTGFSRNYNFYPYGDYDDNEQIIFPISVRDTRYPLKEIMYVVNAYDSSVAFPVKEIGATPISVDVGGKKVTASIDDGLIVVKDTSGKVIPGYHEMWFSWAIHHQEDGVVWQKSGSNY